MQEFELIRSAQKGDLRSMEELLQQNYAILKGYLVKVTLDRELAADLTQETMLRAIKKIKKFKNKSRFSSWLIAIGSNLYKDYLKKNKPLMMVANFEEIVQNTTEVRETDLELTELLTEIPSDKRMVLVLKHYFGYNYEEIGQILDCPVGTVKSRMYYCMDFLQKKVGRRRKDE